MGAAAGLLRVGEALCVVGLAGGVVALPGFRDDLGVEVEDFFEVVAKGLADADRLGAQARGEGADGVVGGGFLGQQAGRAGPGTLDEMLRRADAARPGSGLKCTRPAPSAT